MNKVDYPISGGFYRIIIEQIAPDLWSLVVNHKSGKTETWSGPFSSLVRIFGVYVN